jgi:hypothetical protein
MNYPGAGPEGIDPDKLRYVLTTVHAQVVVALWLSAGMILAFASLVCIAFRLRRAALCFGCGYSLTLFFVHNGHALILGTAGCATCVIGLLWPAKKPDRRDSPLPRSPPG